MKKFLIINGKNSRLIKRESLKDAITTAQNTCDHSHEVIVREIETFTNYSKA